MKLLISSIILAAASFTSFGSSAAQMECYVDTKAYDQFTPNRCFSMVWGQRTSTAVFRVANTTKAISNIIWQDDASSCGSGSNTHCSFTVYSFQTYTGTATVLYADGTWEKVSAKASFEDGR